MNLIEEVEKAFQAGVQFAIDATVVMRGETEFPSQSEVDKAMIEYVNKREITD